MKKLFEENEGDREGKVPHSGQNTHVNPCHFFIKV